MKATANDIKAATTALLAIAEAIREAGSIPSGHLYAQVMPYMSLSGYEQCVRILTNAGIVAEAGNVLTWTAAKAS